MFGFEKNIFEKATKKFIQFTKKTVQKVVETAANVFERGAKKYDEIKDATRTKDIFKDFAGSKDLKKKMLENFNEISLRLEYEQKLREQKEMYEKKLSEYEEAQRKYNERMRRDFDELSDEQKESAIELGITIVDEMPEEVLPEEEKKKRIKEFERVYNGGVGVNQVSEAEIQKKEQFLDNLLSGYEDDPVFAEFVEKFREAPIGSQLQFMKLYAEDLKQQYLDYKSGRVSMMHVHDTLKEYNEKLESLYLMYA